MIADQLAEALRELKREIDDLEYVGGYEEPTELVISARTLRLVEDALRAYWGRVKPREHIDS